MRAARGRGNLATRRRSKYAADVTEAHKQGDEPRITAQREVIALQNTAAETNTAALVEAAEGRREAKQEVADATTAAAESNTAAALEGAQKVVEADARRAETLRPVTDQAVIKQIDASRTDRDSGANPAVLSTVTPGDRAEIAAFQEATDRHYKMGRQTLIDEGIELTPKLDAQLRSSSIRLANQENNPNILQKAPHEEGGLLSVPGEKINELLDTKQARIARRVARFIPGPVGMGAQALGSRASGGHCGFGRNGGRPGRVVARRAKKARRRSGRPRGAYRAYGSPADRFGELAGRHRGNDAHRRSVGHFGRL